MIGKSSFTKYILNESETITSQLLTQPQKENIQNLLCEAAEMRLALVFNPLNPSVFIQEEAGLSGRITILKYLLEASELAELELANHPQA